MTPARLTAHISLVPEHTNDQDMTEEESYQFILTHVDYWRLHDLAAAYYNPPDQHGIYLLWFCCGVVTCDPEGNETEIEPYSNSPYYRCRLPVTELASVVAHNLDCVEFLTWLGETQLIAIVADLTSLAVSLSTGN